MQTNQKKMRVLQIDFSYPENNYSLELDRQLLESCDITLFCKEGKLADEPAIRMIPAYREAASNRAVTALRYANSLRRLRGLLLRGHFDIVHVQFFKKPFVEIPLLLRCRRAFPCLVTTVHNVLPHEATARDVDIFNRLFDSSDALLVHNEATRAALLERFPALQADKILQIAHGAYGSYDLSAARRDDDPRRHFLTFGGIRPYKGIDTLLRAVALLPPEARQKARFLVAGKQYPALDPTDYRQMIETLGIGDCVTFSPERVADEDVPALLGNADVGVFPYRHIYGSGALLMNYTFGVPVIASDIPAFREETNGGETGLLFRADDPEALRNALLCAIDWDEARLASYRAAIRRLVAEKYNWAVSGRKLSALYRRLLEE